MTKASSETGFGMIQDRTLYPCCRSKPYLLIPVRAMPVNGEPWESCKDVLLVWQLAQKTDDGEFWPTALFLASPYFDSDFLDQHEVVPLFKPQVPRQPMPAKAKAGASGSNAKRAKNPKASADDAAQHIGVSASCCC